MKTWMSAVVASSVVLAARASADDATLKWQTVVGIIQAGNVVGGITGGGQPWSTLGGNAVVNLASGRVHFRVDGLVLAGSDAIGTPGPITEVMGTLVCGPSTFDTPSVPLSSVGDAHFDGEFLNTPPGACATEPDVAFLVRIATGSNVGRWIANGAVLLR